MRRRCRSRRASAAPATRSAPSRSTSRRCCCICARPPDPPRARPSRRLDAEPRPEAARTPELPRLVALPMNARDAVLGRVRAAIGGGRAPAEPAYEYRRAGTRDRDALVELFCERAGEYRADVRVVADVGAA